MEEERSSERMINAEVDRVDREVHQRTKQQRLDVGDKSVPCPGPDPNSNRGGNHLMDGRDGMRAAILIGLRSKR